MKKIAAIFFVIILFNLFFGVNVLGVICFAAIALFVFSSFIAVSFENTAITATHFTQNKYFKRNSYRVIPLKVNSLNAYFLRSCLNRKEDSV